MAHLVCRALGLDSQAYTDAYVLGWADGDMDLVKECAQTILRVAKAILADLAPADASRSTDGDGEADAADDGSDHDASAMPGGYEAGRR